MAGILPWLIPRPEAVASELLDEAVRQEDPAAVTAALRPSAPFYHHLRGALARYGAAVQAGGWQRVGAGATLREGDRDARVRELRARLLAEGDPAELALLEGAPDHDLYGPALVRAVEHFQRRHGLAPDGAVGAATLEALNVPAEERLLALRLNLDRWRWLPADPGSRYILVNVAGFELVVMEGEEDVMRMDVIVGQEAYRTPLFQDTLEYVVVNPYWNVPRSIAQREIIPSALRDRGYLARNDYEVVDASGRQVDPYSADISSRRYTIRQRPGPKNALGEVKFLFPNAMDIYLHDTPARHLFGETHRTFSSGCIRVEKPRELAEYLLATSTSRPAGTYDRLRRSGREQWVALDEKLPIYILYFTAWAEPDGSVRFHPDVYERDRAVAALARAELGTGDARAATVAGGVAARVEE